MTCCAGSAPSVVAEKPDLVLWQFGTNSLIRDHTTSDYAASIHTGVDTLKVVGADVILVDPQFAPKVIAKPGAERIVELIGASAKTESVDLFQRFALMRRWHDVDQMSFEADCVARRASHERLELWLPGQGAGRRDRRSRDPSGRVGFGGVNYTLSFSLPPKPGRRARQILDDVICAVLEPPAESRTKPSPMQSNSARCAGVSRLVRRRRRVGDQALPASPRLLLMRISFSASWNRNAALPLPPLTSKETRVEPPRICFCTMAACG